MGEESALAGLVALLGAFWLLAIALGVAWWVFVIWAIYTGVKSLRCIARDLEELHIMLKHRLPMADGSMPAPPKRPLFGASE